MSDWYERGSGLFLSRPLTRMLFCSGMYKWLAGQYPEKAEKLRKAHHRNYDAWNRLKLEPEFTEADYWSVVIKNGTPSPVLLATTRCL